MRLAEHFLFPKVLAAAQDLTRKSEVGSQSAEKNRSLPGTIHPAGGLYGPRLLAQPLLSEGQIMNIGTVKWFSLEKGYGFIHPDDGRPNIFVHISAVESAGMSGLTEGQKVIFQIHQDERTGRTSAVSLQDPVFAPTPRLDDPFATTNTFHLFSAFVSSAFSPRLPPH